MIWVGQSTTSCLVYQTQSVAKNVLFLGYSDIFITIQTSIFTCPSRGIATNLFTTHWSIPEWQAEINVRWRKEHSKIIGFSGARHSESSTFVDIWFLKCRNWCDLPPGTTGPIQTSGKAVLAQGSRCQSGSVCQIRHFNAATPLLPLLLGSPAYSCNFFPGVSSRAKLCRRTPGSPLTSWRRSTTRTSLRWRSWWWLSTCFYSLLSLTFMEIIMVKKVPLGERSFLPEPNLVCAGRQDRSHLCLTMLT